MNPFRCLIIEDEPIAAAILQGYIEQTEFLSLQKIFYNAVDALLYLQTSEIDLIFLDINLPKLKGLDFLQLLPNSPSIILCTAYSEYALESYQYKVIDYLMKPIEYTQFLKATTKFLELKSSAPTLRAPSEPISLGSMVINVNKAQVKVFFEEIVYIESKRDYVHLVTKTETLAFKCPISEMEESLPAAQFSRIHRSFLINHAFLQSRSAKEVKVGGFTLPVGRSYRELVKAIPW